MKIEGIRAERYLAEKDDKVIRHVVMDMDGVLYRGDDAVPGAIETMDILHKQGIKVAFLTNNASRHREELMDKLARLGVPCALEQVWGSAYTTARYLVSEAPNARIFVIGMPGMIREMTEAGLTVVSSHKDATHVVVGLDRGITYEKLKQAHHAICSGAIFIATNGDATFPDSPTTTSPGAGAIIAALHMSTDVQPIIIGKPEPLGISLIASSWGVGPEAIVAVGDRLDTDIVSAKGFGCLAVLVLTGIAQRDEAEQVPDEYRPDVVIDNLTELLPVLKRQHC